MLRTKSGLPKHCGWNLDRINGKRRVRFRKGGFSTYLTGIPWSQDFMRQYAAALEGVAIERPREVGESRTIPGSFDALCVSYYRSPEFQRLSSSTQAVRRNVIERFRNDHGKKPIALLTRAHIKQIIGAKSETPEAANNLLKVLRVLLGHAVDIDMIASNPAIDVQRYPSKGEGIHTWTESEVARFEARFAIGSKPRLALALLLYTAARRSDVVRLGWQHVQGDAIAFRQKKTDAALVIPMLPELVQVLAASPRDNLTFLVTERGKSFSAAGFGNWFRDRCNEAGLPQCSAHGLRKCAATRLADAGCSLHEVMAITGHRSMSEVSRYTKAADQARLARQAARTLTEAREQKASAKLSSIKPMLDKKRKKPR
jgi:integrase